VRERAGAMIKTIFLVPVRDNSGRLFPPAYWRDLRSQLMGQFGAFSRRSGVLGMWQAGGRVYQDVSYEYTISLTSWRQLAAWLAVVDQVRERFRQEAIYVEIAGVPEILVAE
jgi:hypothetical protein